MRPPPPWLDQELLPLKFALSVPCKPPPDDPASCCLPLMTLIISRALYQMQLGRRLAVAVPGPVHAVGHPLEHRGVHGVEAHPEAGQQSPASPAGGERGMGVLQFAEHRPEQFFDELGVAVAVGVGAQEPAGCWRFRLVRKSGTVASQV